ncbi:MAG: hypothetical protein QOD51_2396 [Candidatus Eremiobacteraeota bacterium]|nr:hypothetical protein [Candidatus Eremiobacteraeota bacterium]
MRDTIDTDAHIKGWQIDADPSNDPTYPMRRRLDADQHNAAWMRPPRQPVDVEDLHSIERPDLTAVFGTSTPPSGLSGTIRRAAFAYSESSYLHWLPLVLADRINVVEGVLDDLRRGRIPNVLAEAGGKAEWTYNRRSLIDRTFVLAAIVTVTAGYVRALRMRRSRGA